MTKLKKEAALPKGLSEEAREEILERRRARELEQRAREDERKAAWKDHEQERKDAEARRKATEPPKEFVEAARAARERLAKERVEFWRKSFEAECKRRNEDEVLERRFWSDHDDVAARHLTIYARFQDAMAGSDEAEKREAALEMAAAWKEKEDLLIALAAKKRKNAPDPLEARTETLKDKLEVLEKTRKAATPKVKKPKAEKKAKAEKSEKPAKAPAKKSAPKK